MTEKLYYTNPYLEKWEARILDIIERDGKYLILLDKTAFYPEGGGQPCDRGFIDGIEVLEVFEENKDIYHVVSEKPEKGYISCSLDFKRRQDLMQQHTGQHLLSSVFFNKFKGETSSFHLGEDYVSVDISLSDINEDMLKEIELQVNQLIYRNLSVKTYFVEKENINKLPLRKFPKVEEDIRIVEIDNTDFSPCCGTHVIATGQLGIIKIVKAEKYKGVTRIYFKCGKRALLDFQKKQESIQFMCKLLSTDIEALNQRVEGTLEELNSNKNQIKALKERLYSYEAEAITKNRVSYVITESFEDKTFEEVQELGKAILKQGDYILILASLKDKKLWLAYNGPYDIHCGKIFKERVKEYEGRGGGGETQAQASFETEALMLEFQEALKAMIKSIIGVAEI